LNDSKAVLKDAAQFTISGYIASTCNFVSAVIVRSILDPFFMGIYVQLLLIFDYAKYSHLGVINSLDRQIPYYRGKKEVEKVEEIKNTGISFSFLASLISALVIIFLSLFLKNRLTPSLFAGLKIVAMMVVIQSMSTFYVTLVRTHHLFDSLSRYLILVAVCDVLFKVILGIKFGIIGILWATVITLGIGLVYLFKRTNLHFRLRLKMHTDIIKSLLVIGFPLLLAGFTFMVLRSIDRIMIIALLTKEDLGFYSIAIMMFSFVFQLPNLIYTVLFPRFYEAFAGSENNIDKLKGYLEKPTLAFAYLFPVFIGVAIIILPVFIKYVLPKYMHGVIPASILLFGAVFVSITNMSGYLLVALKKQNNLVLIGGMCVIINVILNFVLVKTFHLGIRGVALGTALSYFLYSILLIGCAIKYYIRELYNRIRFFLNLYMPCLWVLFIFYIYSNIFSYAFKSLKSDTGNMSLQIVIFLILTSPLVFYAHKKINLYRIIKNVGFNFFKK